MLAVLADVGCRDIFFPTARFRMKYYLKGQLNSKQRTNQFKLYNINYMHFSYYKN